MKKWDLESWNLHTIYSFHWLDSKVVAHREDAPAFPLPLVNISVVNVPAALTDTNV